ncbi:MAG TPA: hypothetical protein VGF56_12225 [Rhizomicrobium sp.]|jgi:hypothetical protein
MDLNDYRSTVARLFDEASNSNLPVSSFDNYGASHAQIVLDEMVRRARASIKIYSRRLNSLVYNAAWFEAFLIRSREGRILFYVEEPDVFTSEGSILSRSEILRTNPRVQTYLVAPENRRAHLALIDDRIVRVETSQDHMKATVAVGPSTLMSLARESFVNLGQGSTLLTE